MQYAESMFKNDLLIPLLQDCFKWKKFQIHFERKKLWISINQRILLLLVSGTSLLQFSTQQMKFPPLKISWVNADKSSLLWISSHLLKRSLMENLIFAWWWSRLLKWIKNSNHFYPPDGGSWMKLFPFEFTK